MRPLWHLVMYQPWKPGEALSARRQFTMHRVNAGLRGIPFKLTFEQWVFWWLATGHYYERGKRVGRYVMARKGDKGAYELGNIECVQAQTNSVIPHRGAKRSASWCAAISKSQIRRHKQRRKLTKRTAYIQESVR